MQILDQILAIIGSAEAQAAVIALVVEFVLRVVKTKKPLSILWIGVGFVKVGASAAAKAAQILEKVAGLADKVLPQKLAEPKV